MAVAPKKITMINATSEPYFFRAELRRFSSEPVIEDMGYLVSRILRLVPVIFLLEMWRSETTVTLPGE
jgi:hypothetical protein